VDKKTKAMFSEIMREIGRKGGKIGGKRSLETMTPEERTARARKAGQAAAAKKRAGQLLPREAKRKTQKRK
jgi:general stress protein YciG